MRGVRERVMGAFLGGLSKDIWRTLTGRWLNKCDNLLLREAIMGDIASIQDIAESAVESRYDHLVDTRVFPIIVLYAPDTLRERVILAAINTGDLAYVHYIARRVHIPDWWNALSVREIARRVSGLRSDETYYTFSVHLPCVFLGIQTLLLQGPNHVQRFLKGCWERLSGSMQATVLWMIVQLDELEVLQLLHYDEFDTHESFKSFVFRGDNVLHDCRRTLEWLYRVKHVNLQPALLEMLRYTSPETWKWAWGLYPDHKRSFGKIVSRIASLHDLLYFFPFCVPFSFEHCEKIFENRLISDKDVQELMEMHRTNPAHYDELCVVVSEYHDNIEYEDDEGADELIIRFNTLLCAP